MATSDETEERQVLCSGCLEVFPESVIHVIPTFNSDVAGYVISFRCEHCWAPALEETRVRLENTTNEDEIASVAAMLELHGVFLLEFRRGDEIAVVRRLLVKTIDLLKSGAIRLSIGPTRPV
jgi:hypothetical protein